MSRLTAGYLARCALPAAQLLLTVALVGSVLCVPYLPTHDGPQHIFTLHAANHFDAPGTGWSRWLEPNQPVSNNGFSALFTPLDLLFPWQTAVRIALALLVALWALGAFTLARSVHPERGWLGLAVGAAALQWTLYMGFFSFYAASCVGLFTLAVALRAAPGARRDLGLAGLLFVQALLHLAAAALTGAAVAALEVLDARRGARIRALGRAVRFGAPAAAVALLAVAVQLAFGEPLAPDPNHPWRYETAPLWTLAKCFVAGPGWRAWPLTLLALASPVLALTVARGRSSRDRALLISGAAFLAAAVLLPLHLPNWEYFSVRFAPLGVVLGLLALPVERLPRAGRGAVALCAAAFATAATAWGFVHHRDLYARSAAALAGLEAPVRSEGARLPIVLDPFAGRAFDDARADVPYVAPLMNLGKLYATAQGGMVPYTFSADAAIHGVLLSPWGQEHMPPAVDPRSVIPTLDPANAGNLAQREAVATYFAANGASFDDVIFVGRPEDGDHLLWLGYQPLWRKGGVVLARFRGCPRTLRFTADSPVGDDDVLELGWFPALDPARRYALARARREPDGVRVLPMRESCGALWVRFVDPRLACEGADAEGRWRLPPARSPQSECRVVERGSASRGH